MAKFIRDYDIGQNGEAVFNDINAYLVSEGYKYVKYKGQDVFKKGNGFVSGPTFFKLTFYGSVLRLETWLAYAWLPGVYSGLMSSSARRSKDRGGRELPPSMRRCAATATR